MREKDKIVLWPAYFDSIKTRKEGRKIQKSQAIQSPRIEELQKAVQRLGLQFQMVTDSAYSKEPWHKTGSITVTKKDSKIQTIRKIAKLLPSIRAEH